MRKRSIEYFDNIIMPLIRGRHSDILLEMSMRISGSVGQGNDDEYSDLDSEIYLPDDIWKWNGLLQIELDQCVAGTNLWKQDGALNGSMIAVHPLSWLLDYQAEKVLANGENVPWDKLKFETLFSIHEDFVYHDPQDRFGRLRRLTAPEKMPENLWKKAIYKKLHDFLSGGIREIEISVWRKQYEAAYIQFGSALQALYELGFLICHQYYPYPKHLRWAFGKLPAPVSKLAEVFQTLSVTEDWQKRLESIESIYNGYKDYMVARNIAPELDFSFIDPHDMYIHNYMTQAVFFKAWYIPFWFDEVRSLREKAVRLGYGPEEFWAVNWWQME
jgi:hypothetical protein